MFCSVCGSQIPDDSRFCGNCGAVTPQGAAGTAGAGGGEGATGTEGAADATARMGAAGAGGAAAAAGAADVTARMGAAGTGAGATGTGLGAGAAGGGATPGGQFGPRGPSGPAGGAPSQPPGGMDRTLMWIALAIAAVVIITAAIALPLLLLGRDGGDSDSSTTTGLTTTTTVAPTTTETPETTTTAAPETTAPPTTAPPTTAAPSTTTTTGIPGDSAGDWNEMTVPGGPWEANGVAVSDDALLLQTDSASGFKLYAVMLGSGDVIDLAEADALWHFDIDGRVAVWWEGNDWSDAQLRYTDQHIYTYRLPDGPQTEIVGGGRMTLAQIALPWVTWAEYEPWVDDEEYNAYRIIAQKVNDNGEKVGTPREYVSLALAYTLGDSGWHYSVSNLYLTWEHAIDAGGYGEGTHILEFDTEDHGVVSSSAWRPSLWEDVLVYTDTGLKYTYVSAGGTHTIDAAGQYPTAGPDFAAYYRLAGAGSEIVAKGYSGAHEQILGSNPDPPWFCPNIAVSAHHIAFVVDTDVYLFEWGG